MLYTIGLLKLEHSCSNEILRYTLFDTLSESVMHVTENQLLGIIINYNNQIANATMHDSKLHLKDWIKKITVRLSYSNTSETIDYYIKEKNGREEAGCPFTLLTKDENTYRLVSHRGVLINISLEKLKELIMDEQVANCRITGEKDSAKILGTDTYNTIIDKEFEKSIAEKYRLFEAKARILGNGSITFDYEIKNQQVKLKKYTGSSSDIIIPSFITAINDNAFDNINITKLNLNEGLEFIGNGAFNTLEVSNALKTVEIPSTVKIIGHKAFANNVSLYGIKDKIRSDRFKLRNTNTIILDETT